MAAAFLIAKEDPTDAAAAPVEDPIKDLYDFSL